MLRNPKQPLALSCAKIASGKQPTAANTTGRPQRVEGGFLGFL